MGHNAVEKMSVDELKVLVGFIAKLGGTTWEIMEDGKVGIRDLPQLWTILRAAQAIVQVNYGKVALELGDLSDEEKDELGQIFRDGFNGPIEDIERTLECVVAVAIELYDLVTRLVKLFTR